ncbi:MOSC domain-containing protein [Candidatus Peregrinibacteria bacterium]|nr:MOSC domain-containing protein [Candidatus Peregrinibacteria bacterium]
MVTNAANDIFRSQRHKGFEGLARVRPERQGDALILHADGMESMITMADEEGPALLSTIWDARVRTVEHRKASEWMSDFLHQECKFVRQVGTRFVNDVNAPTGEHISLVDRFPLLALHRETVTAAERLLGRKIDASRFRYNFLFEGGAAGDENHMQKFRINDFSGKGAKPCPRCPTIDVNQETGIVDETLLRDLKPHFGNTKGQVIMGENCIVENLGTIVVGSPVEIEQWREEGWDREFDDKRRTGKFGAAWRGFRALGFKESFRWLLRRYE